jgi:hypothetical protein
MRKRFLAVTACASAFALLALAGGALAQSFRAFVVKDIRVEGLQRTEPGTVFSYLPVKVGETMTEEKAQQALRALFATGFFRDVRLEVENDVLVVMVDERPAVAQIDLVGIKEFDADTMKRILRDAGLSEGRTFDRAILDGAEQELKRQYLSRGPLCRRSADHGHAARAQPRRHQHFGQRGRRREDPLDQHRRRAGVPRERPARAVRAAHAGLADLVHQARPVLQAEARRRPRDAEIVLPGPGLHRLRRRVDAGGDHARQEGHLHHRQRSRGGKYTVSDVRLEGQMLLPRAEVEKLVRIRPARCSRACG